MKYEVMTPLIHDGKEYKVGELVELKDAQMLLELQVVKEQDKEGKE